MARSISRPVPPHAQKTAVALHGLPSPLDALRGLFRLLGVWTTRWQDRQHLREMDDHMLHDLGLSREELEQEVSKPFWRG